MHNRPFYTTRTFYFVMTTAFILVLALIFTETTRDLRDTIQNTFVAETDTAQTLTVENDHYLALKAKLNLPEVAPQENASGTIEAPTATTSESAAKMVTPITVSNYTLAVRNGTGINGLANKLATILESAGFQRAKTSNATPQAETEIYTKADIREQVVNLLKIAAPELLIDAKIMENEPTSADIVIIMGSK